MAKKGKPKIKERSDKEKAVLRKKVLAIVERLEEVIPDSSTALSHHSPLELLIATILSAQCTDERVNEVTKSLFKAYRNAEDYATGDIEKLEEQIRSTGFYKQKAKNIKSMCQALVERYGGEAPGTLDELVELPGVGRKTANLVLSEVYGIPGVIVDTHVKRLTNRIGLTTETDPVKIEFDLMDYVPEEHWAYLSDLLIWHGRRTCPAKKPRCPDCVIRDLCDYPDKTVS